MDKSARIYVAGHRGLVGSAICRRLQVVGFTDLITIDSSALDLRNQADTHEFLCDTRPDYVFLAAGTVGGIGANSSRPANFIYDNLMIQANVIEASYKAGVRKLLILGSSCIYPRLAPQPIAEDALLTGPLEPTNEWYAVAKIAAIKMAQAYRLQYGFRAISVMPTNLYGPGDNFDPNTSHVLPALIRKIHDAKMSGSPSVTLWGTGTPRREFLHVDDLARAAVLLMDEYDEGGIINVGSGWDIPISDLAVLIRLAIGYSGDIVFDTSKPDGTPCKLLETSRLKALGWKPQMWLYAGIEQTYAWFLDNVIHSRHDKPSASTGLLISPGEIAAAL